MNKYQLASLLDVFHRIKAERDAQGSNIYMSINIVQTTFDESDEYGYHACAIADEQYMTICFSGYTDMIGNGVKVETFEDVIKAFKVLKEQKNG